MKTSTAIGVTLAAVALATVSLLVQTWILAMILSWFSVSLSFGQVLLIIILANLIFKNNGSSN